MATISFTMYSIVVNNEDTVYGYHLLHHVQYRREYIVSSLFTTILYMVKEMVAIHRVFIIHDDNVHGEGDGSHTSCLHYSRRYCTW
jgi:hypothetical protein